MANPKVTRAKVTPGGRRTVSTLSRDRTLDTSPRTLEEQNIPTASVRASTFVPENEEVSLEELERRLDVIEEKGTGDVIQAEFDVLSGQVAGVADQVTTVDADLDLAEAAIVALDGRVTTAESNAASAQAAAGAASTAAGTAQTTASTALTNAATAQEAADAAQADADQALLDAAAAAAAAATAQGEVDAVELDVTTLTGRVDALETFDASDLTLRVSTLETDVGAAEDDILALDGRVTTAEGVASGAATAAATAQGDVAALDLRVDALETFDATILTNRVTAAEADIDTAEADILSLEGRMTTVEGVAAGAQTAASTAQGEVDAAELRIDALEATDLAYDTRITSAQNDATQALAAAATAQDTADAAIGGGSGSFLDVTVDLITAAGTATNAAAGVAGGGDVIQAGIDYLIANPETYAGLYLPKGTYRLTKPLVVRNGTGTAQVDIIGGNGIADPGSPSAVLQLDGGLNADTVTYSAADGAVLFVQGGVGCSFQGVGFVNTGNPNPAATLPADILTKHQYTDWISAGARTINYSPCAAVCVDPFMDGSPGGSSANQYPNFSSQYATAVSPSDNVVFAGCYFQGGVVGVGMSLPLATARHGRVLFDQCVWSGNAISIAGQGGGVELRSFRMSKAYVHLDNLIVDPGSFSTNPGMYDFSGSSRAEDAYYLCALNTYAPLRVADLTVENVVSIGEIGVESGQSPAKFDTCRFTFMTGEGQAIDDGEASYTLYSAGVVEFANCQFGAETSTHLLKFANTSTSWLTFYRCRFAYLQSNSLPLGVLTPSTVQLRDCRAYSQSGGGETTLNSFDSRWEYIDPGVTATVAKVGAEATGNVVNMTFTSGSLGNVRAGDLVSVWDGTSISVPRVQTIGGTVSLTRFPVGVVEGAVGDVVTVRGASRALTLAAGQNIFFTRVSTEFPETSIYTVPNYLTNRVTFNSASQASVQFRTPSGFRIDIGSDYDVLLSSDSNETFWVSSQTSEGFLINSSNPSSTARVVFRVVPLAGYGTELVQAITQLSDLPGLALLLDPTGVGVGSAVRWADSVGLVDSLGNPLKATQQMTIFGPSTAFVPPPEVLDERILFTGNSSGGVFGWDGFDPVAEFGSTSTWFARGSWINNGTGGYVFYNAGLEDRFAISSTNSWHGPYPASRITMTGAMGGGEKTVIVSRSGANMFAAVDGVVVGSTAIAASFTHQQLICGGFTNFSGAGQYTQGSFRVLGAYGNAITQNQAAQLHDVLMNGFS